MYVIYYCALLIRTNCRGKGGKVTFNVIIIHIIYCWPAAVLFRRVSRNANCCTTAGNGENRNNRSSGLKQQTFRRLLPAFLLYCTCSRERFIDDDEDDDDDDTRMTSTRAHYYVLAPCTCAHVIIDRGQTVPPPRPLHSSLL